MSSGISIRNVTFEYVRNVSALNNISFEIKEGAFLGITGVNGSGKSTFSYLLNGLIPHQIKGHLTGEIIVDGVLTKTQSVAFFAKKVGMVFQNPDFSLFNLTVREELEFGLKNLGLDHGEKRLLLALKKVGMADYLNRDPQTLSLGEKQKISLACVLALDTKYIILDEPTAQLDYKSSLELYKILHNLNINGKTIITVEHDTDFLWQFSREVLILDKGKIILRGPAKTILQNKKTLNKLGIKVPNS